MKGKAFEVRYADDALLCFERKEDAVRVMKVLTKRLAKYGLEVHGGKTRLVNFKKPPQGKDSYKQVKRPGTFGFLGFSHFWKTSRKRDPVIGRKTISKKMTKAIRKIYDWCRKNRHKKIREQFRQLKVKIKGHYNYFGICGNAKSLEKFFLQSKRAWFKWLKRRSNRRDLYWDKFNRILDYYRLPQP